MSASASPSARLCWWLVAVATVALVVLGALFVPWSWVPGGQLVPVSGDEVFTSAQLDRAEAYSSAQRHLAWASLAVSLLLTIVLGLTRWGARLVPLTPGPWWLQVVLGTLAILAAGELVTAPFALSSRANALDAGLTTQSIEGWLRDQGVSLLVGWAFSAALVLLVVGTARRDPRRWPLYTAVAGAALTLLGSWGYPLVVEPLFNEFTSLPASPLRSEIMALARAQQVPVADVLVADASRRTTTLNAYVSGLASTRRVVLYDNLVEDVPTRETLVIVAHELGHARSHDVLIGTLLGASGVVLGSGLLGLVLSRRRLLARAGVLDVGQPEVTALVLALATVGALLASPMQNTASRAIEARADRSSLQATKDYADFEAMHRTLAVRSLSDDDPPRWSQFWFGSHPTSVQRIGLARAVEQRDSSRDR